MILTSTHELDLEANLLAPGISVFKHVLQIIQNLPSIGQVIQK
jgi:hypothetical protein